MICQMCMSWYPLFLLIYLFLVASF
jgi:hypothetical protein